MRLLERLILEAVSVHRSAVDPRVVEADDKGLGGSSDQERTYLKGIQRILTDVRRQT